MPDSAPKSLKWLSFGTKEWRLLPNHPGVYRFYDKNEQLLYVGKAKALVKRVGSYFQNNRLLSGKTRRMVAQIDRIMYTEVPSEHDALLLENNLIKAHKPKYNILLRDDKTYPYLCFTKEPFPRLITLRRRGKVQGRYIGPYTSSYAMKHMREELQRSYKLRSCKYDLSEKPIQAKKYKVCLEYHMGNCLGPCEGLQSEAAYAKEVEQALLVLKGKGRLIQENLRRARDNAAGALHFEEAQRLQHKLTSLAKLQSRSVVVSAQLNSLDVCTLSTNGDIVHVNYMQVVEGAIVISDTFTTHMLVDEEPAKLLGQLLLQLRQRYASAHKEILVNLSVSSWAEDVHIHCPKQGDKRHLVELSLQNTLKERLVTPKKRPEKVLRQLQRELRLASPPRHMVCVDISNLHASQVVASMVSFRDAKPNKNEYRTFHIRTLREGKPDDYASIREVIKRYFLRLEREKSLAPDLIVVDGGKGQVNAAHQVLEALDIEVPLIGIAKRLEEVFVPGSALALPIHPEGESSRLLQRMRNEAHRTALAFHRKTRSNQALSSSLTQVPGIGEATRTKLFRHFSTLSAIKAARFEDLTACIGKYRANILQQTLRKLK